MDTPKSIINKNNTCANTDNKVNKLVTVFAKRILLQIKIRVGLNPDSLIGHKVNSEP